LIPADSFIIIIVAIGAVILLFVGDYYYRYLDNKRRLLTLLEIENDSEMLELHEGIQLSFPEDEEISEDLDSDNLAA